jgi:ABC-type glycerol-3-phosphate transport system substrate-binding protein
MILRRRTHMRMTRSFATICLLFVAATGFSRGTAQQATATGPVELKMYSWVGAGPEYDRNVAFFDWFQTQYPNITVRYEVPGGNFHQAIFTDFAAGIAPDVFYMGGRELEQYHDLGIIAPLTRYLETDERVDHGDILALPLNYFRLNQNPNEDVYALSIGWTTYLVYFNETMFREAGLQTPQELYEAGRWNAETFLSSIRALAKDTTGNGVNDQFGFEIPGYYTEVFQLIGANGGTPFMENQERMTYDDPAVREVYRLVHQLRYGEHVIPAPGDIEGYEGFPTGKIGMRISGNWNVARLNALGADWDWGVTMIPEFSQSYTNLWSNGIAMSSRTRHPDQAWDLIRELALGRGAQMTADDTISFPLSRKAYETMNPLPIWEESLRFAVPVPRHPKITELQNVVIKYHSAYLGDPTADLDTMVRSIQQDVADVLAD